ncbi:hypothetical protein A2574_02480 [Candidatus Shapirobacteria bacterium RIFOXYD1_FULL_38_32]|uniref:Uncharacterized protein n=2 Tax=Candidatus Shapironibacteriota TaxID=1752721 RepID=A0A1F7STC6_9BACT|nr:MAG: hypothetical protein UT14_C0014G0012 [Candidatus Shapirobacteria bacterium GW2011_GWE1_38_92]OGL56018.1 MAG: hypothetical protein A2195_01580 [Candidatus Shapirobacteria bacterium RIFOXYA1_FULL_39_17]OGL56221.1 MAG: hypothetical protein A2410_00185 [Candidatus Shapirobacteria bacterium RIFOXYC1_FULL_38_24]OGL56427.1 MAG: hypothetical protein A2367_01840 [Candidatus Shapirobacteria bacterium RIFOXYB1_FULL_38_38]OGL58501.1 MAG: hypothetical protein A2574_02480 [Candidatus Shapirobacteria 
MINLIEKGKYKLIETKGQVKILYLGKKQFAWVWVEEIGEILVSSYTEHETDQLLAVGKYEIYEVENEPKLADLMHLELEVGEGLRQGYLLLTGLPDEEKKRARIIPTKELVIR